MLLACRILVIKIKFVNGVQQNMLEQMITIFSSEGFMASVSSNIDVLAGVFDKYLSGLSNLRMASILLMLLAFILFLFLIIVLYVKSIIAFLKSDSSSSAKSQKNGRNEETDKKTEEEYLNEQELERELEKELERDLAQSRTERELREKAEQEALFMQKKQEEEAFQQRDMEKKEQKEREEKNIKTSSKKNDYGMDLDWKKGRAENSENDIPAISLEKLKYQQSNKSLSELLGLIVDMLGRGVDDLKIAQTIMYRNQGQSSEDDIIQTVNAIREFIDLARSGKLAEVRKGKQLPDEATALYHLAEGDSTYALALIEALMDSNIEKTAGLTSGAKRDQLFLETSGQACTFGTLSAISDIHLATGAFELSIELAPKNVNAWSRVGDMYSRVGSHNQAIWAYQNVLNMADEDINISEVSNANKMLSQYYYEQGNNLQAAKLYNESKQYYDSLGINRRPDRQEIEIIEIIESRQREELSDTIAKILGQRQAVNM